MPQYTDHLWSAGFLAQFHHSFLIRDPAKVLTSLQRSYQKAGGRESFTRNEIGVDAQRRLFDLLWEGDGAAPAVIDSDDLLEDPVNMVETYCTTIGTPFTPEALSWEPGDRGEVLWYDKDASVWHEALKNSDGLKPQSRKPVELERLPAEAQELYYAFLPHYRHLHKYRLRPLDRNG